jgi:hypothetical protein
MTPIYKYTALFLLVFYSVFVPVLFAETDNRDFKIVQESIDPDAVSIYLKLSGDGKKDTQTIKVWDDLLCPRSSSKK